MKKQAFVAAAAAALVIATGSVASAQSGDSITILHGIPGVTVDLVVDGELVIAGFDAGDTQDLTPLAGTTLKNIEAREAGGTAVVIGPIDSYDVPKDGNASVVVHLDEGGEPTITSFFNTGGPAEQGRGLLTVRHAASASAVEVAVGDDTLLSDISNGEEAGVVLPAGEITDAWVTVDGERVAALPTLILEANTQLIVYIGGSAAADDLEFYQQVVSAGEISSVATETAQVDSEDDGTPQPDVVNTGDALPSSSPLSLDLMVYGVLFALGSAALLARVKLAGRTRSPLASPITD